MAHPGPASFDTGAASSTTSYNDSLSSAALWMSFAGAGLSALGNFVAVKNQKHQLRSEASAAEFAASMSAINARAAEEEAQAITEAGRREQARVGRQYGQAKAAERASTAGRGIQAGVGSAAETQASIEAAGQTDIYTVNSNAVRAANAARAQAVDERNRGALARVSAANLRGSAGSLDPYSAVAGSLLESGAGIAQQYLARNRYRNRARF